MIATKEQERKTLEKIKQMVAELGQNSYLAAAFTGAFELAEQNIENDWGCTMAEEAERMKREAEEKARKAAELMQQAKKEMLKAEEMQKKFNINREYWEDIRKSLDWAAYQLSDKLGY
jgi:hypothetical protein